MKSRKKTPVRRRKRTTKASVNIVPLVDVLIMLIFFFLVAMQFRKHSPSLEITPPKMETAGRTHLHRPLVISVESSGQIRLDDTPVTLGRLEEFFSKMPHKNAEILITADEASPLGSTATVIDLCRKHSIEKVRLQAR